MQTQIMKAEVQITGVLPPPPVQTALVCLQLSVECGVPWVVRLHL